MIFIFILFFEKYRLEHYARHILSKRQYIVPNMKILKEITKLGTIISNLYSTTISRVHYQFLVRGFSCVK